MSLDDRQQAAIEAATQDQMRQIQADAQASFDAWLAERQFEETMMACRHTATCILPFHALHMAYEPMPWQPKVAA